MHRSSFLSKCILPGILLAIAVILLINPSNAQPSANEIVVTSAQNGTALIVAEGQRLIVQLEVQPGTGYTWELQHLPSVLQQAGDAVLTQVPSLAPAGADSNIGKPMLKVFTFQPVQSGKDVLTLAYRRSWAANAAPIQTFTLQVETQGRFQTPPPPIAAAPILNQSPPTPNMGLDQGLSSSFNWCTQNGCTPIKDQGQCGSCWAFATVGVVESAILRTDGITRDLSEQYMVSAKTYGTCSGGYPAFNLFINSIPTNQTAAGAVYESDLPYQGVDGTLQQAYAHHEKLTSSTNVSGSTVAALKQALVDHGPLFTTICVGNAFQSYSSGVFETNESSTCPLGNNHAVVLVGWDDSLGTNGAWRMRNSWSTGWGESGYMWIGYGISGIGDYGIYAVYGGASTYSVSGQIKTSGGTGVAGVSVSDGTRTATTDSNGNYTLSNVPSGSYTLTPTHSNYSFSPTTLSVTVSGNVSGRNFTATPLFYSVSGRISTSAGTGVAGVVVTATRVLAYPGQQPLTFTAVTNSNGAYTLSSIPAIAATYTLTPAHSNYTFSPTSRNPTVSGTTTGQDFTATLIYRISGRITTSDGAGVAGVTVTATQVVAYPWQVPLTFSAVTNGDGTYTVTGLPTNTDTYTLTPARNDYAFSPGARSLTVSGAMSGQNFTAIVQTDVYLPLMLR